MRKLYRINQIALVSLIFSAALAGSAVQGSEVPPTTATAAAIGDALPAVVPIVYDSGIRGYPYNMPPFDLADFGYVESEFQVSGTGNFYRATERFQSDGLWNVTAWRQNFPYSTRILVRQPIDPNSFSGTVVVEWFNSSTDADADSGWAVARDEFMRQGHAWVGVSAQRGGVAKLLDWDPVRYAALSHTHDSVSYDIFTQVAQLIRSTPETIFNGLTPQHLIATGHSQSALRLTTYVNAFQPLSNAFDGFLIHGRNHKAGSLGNGRQLGVTTFIRSDNTTPVFQLQPEFEIERFFNRARQPDTDYLRTWEIAGAPHIGRHLGAYQSQISLRDEGDPPLSCIEPSNGYSFYYAAEAAWSWLNLWVTNGTQPPFGDIMQTNAWGRIVRDVYGNALGGVRLPDLDVPTATYTTDDNMGAPGGSDRDFRLCPFVGSEVAFDSALLQSLYSSHEDYVNQVEIKALEALQKGFILQEGYDDAISEAEAADIP